MPLRAGCLRETVEEKFMAKAAEEGCCGKLLTKAAEESC